MNQLTAKPNSSKQNGAEKPTELAVRFTTAYETVERERNDLLAENAKLREDLKDADRDIQNLKRVADILGERMKLGEVQAENRIKEYQTAFNDANARAVALETILGSVAILVRPFEDKTPLKSDSVEEIGYEHPQTM